MDDVPGLNPLRVGLCARERERRWVQTQAWNTLILLSSVIALRWQSMNQPPWSKKGASYHQGWFGGLFKHRLALAGEQEAACWLQPSPGCAEEVLKCLVELRPEDFFLWTEKINPNSCIEQDRNFQLENGISTESEVSMGSWHFQQKSSGVSTGRNEVRLCQITVPHLNCSLCWKDLNRFL